jgi:YVTN family beta-propeller protein
VSGTISTINSASNSVTNTIPVGKTPMGVSYNPINNSIYVANLDSNTVTMIKETGP